MPVVEVLDDVVSGLDGHGRVVLEAPPGAGKTSLVPLVVAAARAEGRVVVLEPRRLAAVAAARRMASLISDRVGGQVGWTTGDGSTTSAATRIEVVTEQILVRRLQRDPSLPGVSAVILDEFHERAVSADLALAFSLESQQILREDLGVVVMSATLDGRRVAALLGSDTPVVRSEGRTHPVETVHRPPPGDGRSDPRRALPDAVAAAVIEAMDDHPGDVLAFLPGQSEIRRAMSALQGRVDADVRPLYGALPPAQQQQALDVGTRRRVVLATDIAESSLTVPGVRIVVDGGWARRPAFDPMNGMTGLETVRVSQASADQRRGRAARQGPGLCVRLWPATMALTPFAPPGMVTEDLAPVALDVAAWGTPVAELALLDQPPAATWAAARQLLADLGAIDAAGPAGTITELGRRMLRLPVHPRLAAMVLGAPPDRQGLAADVAALLGERDVLADGDRDLESRLRALSGDRRAGAVRKNALDRARRQAGRIRRSVGAADGDVGAGRGTAGADVVGQLVAAAYPDRIAASRGRRGSFVMAGGRGAVLPESDPLAGEQTLAIAQLDRGAQEARIFLAAALDDATVDAMTTPQITVEWRDGDVVARTEQRVGALVRRSTPLADPPVEAVRHALLTGIRHEELRPLPWSRATSGLRDRLRHLHEHAAADGWPAVDDATLLDGLEDWLGPFLIGVRRRADLRGVNLADALMSRVPYALHPRLGEAAPTHVQVPTGRRVALDYGGERPVLAVKLQELFGTEETPTAAGAPVLVHLLSPAGRPLQVTDDLAGFWHGSYAQVRAEMRGRYPKHPWPEEPWSAIPTRHTKKRMGRAPE